MRVAGSDVLRYMLIALVIRFAIQATLCLEMIHRYVFVVYLRAVLTYLLTRAGIIHREGVLPLDS